MKEEARPGYVVPSFGATIGTTKKIRPVLSEKKLQGGGTILRYYFMAGAQIVPKNRPLDRKEKREECVLCARADDGDVREEDLGQGGGDGCGGGDGDGSPRCGR